MRNLFVKFHMTAHDKIDILAVGVTLTDYMWLIGDMYFAGIHPHHYVIFTFLSMLSILSVLAVFRMCKRHHKAKIRRLALLKEANSYVPLLRHSEK